LLVVVFENMNVTGLLSTGTSNLSVPNSLDVGFSIYLTDDGVTRLNRGVLEDSLCRLFLISGGFFTLMDA
jgi:hypothetical protein